jgi:ATP-dependent RNA helicase SUPV3L1/SUV3
MSEHLVDDAPSVLQAIRRLDREKLPSFLKSYKEGLPPPPGSEVGSREAVFSFLQLNQKAAQCRKVWRRLTEVLEGTVAASEIGNDLSEGEAASLRSLVTSANTGASYHNLRYPLLPGEKDRLPSIDAYLDKAVRKVQRTSGPVKPVVILTDSNVIPFPSASGGRNIGAVGNVSYVMEAAKVCGIQLVKGQARQIAEEIKPWPRTFEALVDNVRRLCRNAKMAALTFKELQSFLADRHGLGPVITYTLVTTLVSSKVWESVPEEAAVAELVAPYIDELLEQSAIVASKAAFRAHAESSKIRFFDDDLNADAVRGSLARGDLEETVKLMEQRLEARVRNVILSGTGCRDWRAVAEMARGGGGRAVVLVRTLMPIMGHTIGSASKSIAIILGADAKEAAWFVEALAEGEKIVQAEATVAREEAAVARKKLAAWRSSLLIAPRARDFLGATPTEFKRWVDAGQIPVAERVQFRKWGSDLSTTTHDPVHLVPLKALLPTWRAAHKAELSRTRSEASKQAAATRKTSTKATESLESVRQRRVSGLAKTANLVAQADATGLRVRFRFTVRDGLEWVWHSYLPLPETVAEAVLLGSEPVVGSARKRAVADLLEAVEAVQEPVKARLEAVADIWRDRLDAVLDTLAVDTQDAFVARIASELATLVEDAAHTNDTAPADDLSRQLDRALAGAVNAHARDWMAENLNVRSGLADYGALFPEARAKRRRFVLHLGPTNSGKTHAALDRLAAAESGAYLAPLRLMALEGSDRLNGERGVPTDMVTGEEISRVDGARHVSATIEMADLSTPIEVAIIDEVQLIADKDRGWAWTQAIVGIPADVVVMTGSADALPFVTRIARMTGDELEVVMFERMTPLTAVPKPVSMHGIQEGDAVVAFSRAEVLRLRQEISDRGLVVATIYGALGPEVRRAQAAAFRSGEAQVLVATDAIAMGLNLPIRRVVFSALDKYDGVSTRSLSASEIRQIGGRAGRYGLSEHGEVAVLTGLNAEQVVHALASAPKTPRDDRVPVMPPWPAVVAVSELLETDNLSKILVHVTTALLQNAKDLRAPSLDDPLIVCGLIQNSGLSLRQRFRYLGCPVATRDSTSMASLSAWSKLHGQGKHVPAPRFDRDGVPETDFGLAECESTVKLLSAYLWLAMRWPSIYTGYAGATAERARANSLIDAILKRKNIGRSCKRCGTKLGKRHAFAICDDCFENNRYERYSR